MESVPKLLSESPSESALTLSEVTFTEDNSIIEMISREGEKVKFVDVLKTKEKNVEHWMGELEEAMRAGVRESMANAIGDYQEMLRPAFSFKFKLFSCIRSQDIQYTV